MSRDQNALPSRWGGTTKLLLCVLAIALFLCAVPAAAAGIDLGWNDCPAGATYALTETFACDTNVGIHTIVVSFVAPANVLAMNATEIVIDMQTSGALLAPWWSLRSGGPPGCRNLGLTHSADFLSGPFACFDYWQGGALGGVSMDAPFGLGVNRARIKALVGLPAGSPLITSVPEGTPVYAVKININNSRTVGPEACGGCSDEACIVLQSIRIDQPVDSPANGQFILVTNPGTAQHVIWQGWSTIDPNQQCPLVTPARVRTWGSLKALYR